MSITQYVEPDEISERTLAVWEKQAAILARSPITPERFRGKPDEIMIAYFGLHDLGVRPGPNTLHKCYVVKGKPGYMAQLQMAVAHRHGWDVEPVEGRCDGESATVRIRRSRSEEEWRHVTFTMADAVKAGLPSQNPTYKAYPTDMLIARATTRAVGRYCPEVMLGIDAAADHAAGAAAAYLGREPLPERDEPGVAAAGQEPAPGGEEDDGIAYCSEGVEACQVEGDHAHDPFIEAKATVIDMPSRAEVSWKQKAKEAGISQGDLIRQAWTLAERFGIDKPATLEDIVEPELVAELSDWLSGDRP